MLCISGRINVKDFEVKPAKPAAVVLQQAYACPNRECLLVENRTRDRKVAGSNPGRSGGRIFVSRVDSLC